MPINIQQGAVNTTNLTAPGLYVGIVAPQPNQLNGTPTNIVGFVGNATYGPTNTPITVANYTQFVAAFGQSVNRNAGIGGGDLGAAVQIALMNGCNNIVCVRVNDYNMGTENGSSGTTSLAAASIEIGVVSSNFALLLTSRYGGSAGNGFVASVQTSQYPNAVKVVLSSGLAQPEVFDNITNASPAAFWAALASAINTGNSALLPRSAYFLATLGTLTSTAIPAVGTSYTLTGGADGITSLSSADYVGVDGTAGTRKGMYALRGTGAALATLVDISDDTTWTAQLAFGLSERIYMVTASPAGDSFTAMATRGADGASGYALKIMFGDWCYFNDTINGIQRLLSPATFVAASRAAGSPALSACNQEIYGIVASQFSTAGLVYSQADISAVVASGYDVITPPGQGASNLPIWSCATGRNSNYNPAANGDNYSTMIAFLVNTISAVGGMGQFVGALLTPSLLRQMKAVLDAFYQNLADAGLIGNSSGRQVFQNTVTSTGTQLQNGITVITSTVSLFAINLELVVNLTAGQTVTFTAQATSAGQ